MVTAAPQPENAVYLGWIRHRRFAPREHRFTYPVFFSFLDIDKLPALMSASKLTSYNRFNWASFDERDHFGDPASPLRARLIADAAKHGITLPDGPIFLLTHLRYFGYCFNPVSFFYCYDRSGVLKTVLAEVNNTFNETHNYWLDTSVEQPHPNSKHYRTPKVFHVSPFLDLKMDYEWVFTHPGDKLTVHMTNFDRAGDQHRTLFDATLRLDDRRPWNAREIRRALFLHPWMTAKVTLLIHWQALRLWLKGVPVVTHPARQTPPLPHDAVSRARP
ncbi:MAG: DUF1365 domain-containing protein [Bryobacteraceae bacterium]